MLLDFYAPPLYTKLPVIPESLFVLQVQSWKRNQVLKSFIDFYGGAGEVLVKIIYSLYFVIFIGCSTQGPHTYFMLKCKNRSEWFLALVYGMDELLSLFQSSVPLRVTLGCTGNTSHWEQLIGLEMKSGSFLLINSSNFKSLFLINWEWSVPVIWVLLFLQFGCSGTLWYVLCT